MVLGSIIVHQQLSQRCAGSAFVYRGIVGNFENVFALRALHMNIDQRASVSGLGNIERALGNFVKSFRQDGGHAEGGIKMQPHGARKTGAHLADQTVQRKLQPGPFHDGRVQLVGDVAQLFDGLFQQFLNFGGAAIHARSLLAEVHAHGIQLQSHRAQNLAHVVMQKPRNARQNGLVFIHCGKKHLCQSGLRRTCHAFIFRRTLIAHDA